ncbi:MAG: arginine--tRNA ligase [Eubacteriales bacterium]|nr:arginine--tRNA ligase [Eubacteriales bacterium]
MVDFKESIAEAVQPLVPELSKDEIRDLIEIPQDEKMGDYAIPCFKLAKFRHMAPDKIAKDVAEHVSGEDFIREVRPVRAYVNFFLNREEAARPVIAEAMDYENFGRSMEGNGKTIVIDFSSPNIAKPFHIGHIRSTVIGNSLYKIFDLLGYNVVRSNHLGDYGTQFGKMIAAYRHWGSVEEVEKEPIKTLLSYYTRFHREAEENPELNEEARQAFNNLEHGKEEEVRLWKWFTEMSMKEFNRVYDMLGIDFDVYDGESMYSDMMPARIQELKDKGLLQESNGAGIVDLSEYDMPPALITKSDGTSLYCTRDIATAVYRKETYDFYKNIYVVASQQTLYFRQLKKVLELMGYDWAEDCVHVPFGMVSLEEGTMSTRKGRVVFLEDVLNKAIEKTGEIIREKNPAASDEQVQEAAKIVGVGAVMFNELSNGRIKDYVFSWDHVLNFDGETGPYVQYTHARCMSVLRNAGEETIADAKDMEKLNMKYLNSDSAYGLIRLIHAFPGTIQDAADKYEPSIVTRLLIDTAQAYNKFYHDEHILVDDKEERAAKVALTIAAKNAIRRGLDLLGLKAPERM